MATDTPTSSAQVRGPGGSPRDSATTKRRILDAAEQVVLRDGVGHLTLEAAAHEAGLSKGGVLYHFPTRDALVAAMVTRIIEQFEDDIASFLPPTGTPEADAPDTMASAATAAAPAPSPC